VDEKVKPMTTCEIYQDIISAALDGELSAFEEQALREHLTNCAACRALGSRCWRSEPDCVTAGSARRDHLL
jgi:predicted anti-sigma-YlaC factor YlaD